MDATVKKALIAMSGGVDSSVAAYLAQKAGYECTGCTMKLHDDPAVSVHRSVVRPFLVRDLHHAAV